MDFSRPAARGPGRAAIGLLACACGVGVIIGCRAVPREIRVQNTGTNDIQVVEQRPTGQGTTLGLSAGTGGIMWIPKQSSFTIGDARVRVRDGQFEIANTGGGVIETRTVGQTTRTLIGPSSTAFFDDGLTLIVDGVELAQGW